MVKLHGKLGCDNLELIMENGELKRDNVIVDKSFAFAVRVVKLYKYLSDEKKEFIVNNAKPWRSVLYLKGHIMLYIGQKSDGEPLVIHDAWGIKSFDANGKEGRYMLGGIVITTLEEGKGNDWYDNEKSSLLNKILGIKDIE